MNLTKAQIIRTFDDPIPAPGAPSDPERVSCSVDGKLAISRHYLTRAWEIDTGKLVQETPVLPKYPNAYSPDGKLCLSCERWSPDRRVEVWDVTTAKLLRYFKLGKGPPRNVEVMAFSPDGRLAAVRGEGHFLRVWDVETGTIVKDLLEEKKR